METHTVVSLVLSIVVNLFMPFAIAYVAKSSKSWLNMLIAYASSAVVGGLTAWLGGNFNGDVWPSVMAGVTASQTAFHAFWDGHLNKPKVDTTSGV